MLDTRIRQLSDQRRLHRRLWGRYANRIAGGAFELDGREARLTRKRGENTLHGGRGLVGQNIRLPVTEENAVEFSSATGTGRTASGDVEAKIHAYGRKRGGHNYFAMSNSDTVLNITKSQPLIWPALGHRC